MRNKTALTLIAAIAISAASAFGQGYHYSDVKKQSEERQNNEH
jgi:hypothetical protein